MADTATDNQPEPAPPTDSTSADNFGDLLAQLLQSLPAEASRLFLMALSGLSPSESAELCRYVDRLRDEKQFRVIKAMAESTVEGKKKFILNLRKKFIVQQAKLAEVQAQEEQNMESHLKRKQALNAASRVKMLNGGANKFHSFNAVVGPDGKENDNQKLPAQLLAGMPNADGVVVGRSLSSSSVVISKEDISQVGRLLSNSHIGDSEMNLRELEINKKGFIPGDKSATQDDDVSMSKRDRPQSSRALIDGEQKPTQRTRPAADTPVATNSENADNSNGNTEPVEDPEAPTTKRWTKNQDAALRESVRIHGEKNWKAIAELVPGRNHAQCLQRWRKVLKPGLVKGHWSFEEDQVLEYLVTQGCNNWGQIAERIPGRTPKQCRERWKNHLDPAINKGPYTEEEDSQSYAPPQQYEGQDYNGYDPRYYERQTSTGVASQGVSPAHQTDHHQQQNGGETWLQPSAASANSAIDQDGMPRIADNQQQQQAQQPQQPGANGPGIWDPYPRQDAAQLSPLSLQALLQDPARASTLDSSFYQTVEQQPAETVTYEIGASSFGGTPFPHTHAL
ncbi:hypothetical protein JG687_00013985 [Phytophthora cactorum]|uniref:Myb domain n=1 Tax=Phytophthora cactorum TaxID=29920 RepID=A0A8T1TXE5_9STRA|nr:hypothetical protein JG687_00013985 [Phytophthora cactorum]